jgi:hypothetical protein
MNAITCTVAQDAILLYRRMPSGNAYNPGSSAVDVKKPSIASL